MADKYALRPKQTEEAKLLIGRAANLAGEAHKGQKRKFGKKKQDYIVHPSRVAHLVANLPESDAIDVAAAWLHDVIEDTPTSAADISLRLAPAASDDICAADQVTHLVTEMTMPSELPANKGKPYNEREQMDLEHLAKVSDRARRLKLCDIYDNVNDLEGAPKDYLERYLPKQLRRLAVIGSAVPNMTRHIKLKIAGACKFAVARPVKATLVTCGHCGETFQVFPRADGSAWEECACAGCGALQKVVHLDD